MKNILSSAKTAIILLVVAILSLGFYAYMLLRPISYGMEYYNETEYEGGTYKGSMKFKSNNVLILNNTNFTEPMEYLYYYKDGYVFITFAQTEEEYEEEVAYINDNFEESINRPFYADKINAFKMVAEESDGYSSDYVCDGAIAFAIAYGIVELILVALTALTFILWKKSKDEA